MKLFIQISIALLLSLGLSIQASGQLKKYSDTKTHGFRNTEGYSPDCIDCKIKAIADVDLFNNTRSAKQVVDEALGAKNNDAQENTSEE